MKLKLVPAAVLALSALAVGNANAISSTTTDLGPITALTTFGGFAPNGLFLDMFTFSLPANGGSSYDVTNFSLIPTMFATAFTSFTVVSNADGIVGTMDDMVIASSTSLGSTGMALALGPTASGNYYLTVGGVATGPSGGIYNGAIAVTAVPEPETYAMMLAGLAALGFLARRRQS